MPDTHFFAGLDGKERPSKPRTQGLTMVVDWGLGGNAQDDLLATTAPYFDFAKIAVGLSRLLPNEMLAAKIEHYRQHEVEPFPGGQYLEYAEVHGKADLYFPAVAEAGYRWIEVSDNLAAVSLEWKLRMIHRASADCGLLVFGEVGQKEGLETPVPMVDDARACVDAGSRIVLLEAAELVSDDPETAKEVEAVVEAVGLETVMFELPGPWISGVTQHVIHRMRRELVDRYGRDVNLGNVMPDDMMTLEAYRRELGINAGKPEDA